MVRRTRHIIAKDGPHPIDVHVGRRVRLRRTLLGMSQTQVDRASQEEKSGWADVLASMYSASLSSLSLSGHDERQAPRVFSVVNGSP